MPSDSLAAQIDFVVLGRNAFVSASGELDISSRELLDAPLATAVAERLNLLVDIADVSFIDLATANALLRTEAQLAAHGLRLRIANPQPRARRLLWLMNAEHLLAD